MGFAVCRCSRCRTGSGFSSIAVFVVEFLQFEMLPEAVSFFSPDVMVWTKALRRSVHVAAPGRPRSLYRPGLLAGR